MRRVEQYTRELPYEQRCVIISKRDYRLMRAVVKAVEAQDANSQTGLSCKLRYALDAFNAPEKRK